MTTVDRQLQKEPRSGNTKKGLYAVLYLIIVVDLLIDQQSLFGSYPVKETAREGGKHTYRPKGLQEKVGLML